MNILLLSLHPRHSQNIFTQKKTIELRKQKPRQVGHILIYETLPTAAIIGYCEVEKILCMDAEAFCASHQSELCLSCQEIRSYLEEKIGYGIKIKNHQAIAPIPLSKMRKAGILPPQGFRYLSTDMSVKLGVPLSLVSY